MALRINFIWCPNNFPIASNRPKIGEFVVLELRHSDTVNEDGIAMIKDGLFLGWLGREWVAILRLRVLSATGVLQGQIMTSEDFLWAYGGGPFIMVCYQFNSRFGLCTVLPLLLM
ncbi:hypothetical protein MMC17_005558 [Xylographa soralifera]|nr:hypothetical protein [Xylographa soralifera]